MTERTLELAVRNIIGPGRRVRVTMEINPDGAFVVTAWSVAKTRAEVRLLARAIDPELGPALDSLAAKLEPAGGAL